MTLLLILSAQKYWCHPNQIYQSLMHQRKSERNLKRKRKVRKLVRSLNKAPSVDETTDYDNLVAASLSLRATAPPPPADKAKRTGYPHTLKVHVNSLKDCFAFAKLIKRKLESDKKAFVFKAGSTTKPEKTTFIEKEKTRKKRKPLIERNRKQSFGRI